VILPIQSSVEHLPNVPEYIAIMHGPVLLGAKTGTEDLEGLIADDSRWAHIAHGERLPIDKAPIIIEDDITSIADKLLSVKSKHLTYTAPEMKLINTVDVEFEPFYNIHDARYMIDLMALSNEQYGNYIDSIAQLEKLKLELQNRTIDYVAPGEQQPEAD